MFPSAASHGSYAFFQAHLVVASRYRAKSSASCTLKHSKVTKPHADSADTNDFLASALDIQHVHQQLASLLEYTAYLVTELAVGKP